MTSTEAKKMGGTRFVAVRAAALWVAVVLLLVGSAVAQDAQVLGHVGQYDAYAVTVSNETLLVAYNVQDPVLQGTMDPSQGDVWLDIRDPDGAWESHLVAAGTGRIQTMAIAAHEEDVYVAWTLGTNLTVASSHDLGSTWTLEPLSGNAAANFRLVASPEGVSVFWQEGFGCRGSMHEGPGRHWESWMVDDVWRHEALWSMESAEPRTGSGLDVAGILSYRCDPPSIMSRIGGEWIGSEAPYPNMTRGQPLLAASPLGAVLAVKEVTVEPTRVDETVLYVQANGSWSRHVVAAAEPNGIAVLDAQRMALVYSPLFERDESTVNNFTWRVVLATTSDAGRTWSRQDILSGDQRDPVPHGVQMVLDRDTAFITYLLPQMEKDPHGRPYSVGNDLVITRTTSSGLQVIYQEALAAARTVPEAGTPGLPEPMRNEVPLKDAESGFQMWTITALGICAVMFFRRRC